MARRKKASRLFSSHSSNPNTRDIASLENDLFREASNLSAVTGANVAVITRRPSGEIRLWGSPSVQSVISQYKLYSSRQIPVEAPSAPAMVHAAEVRARHYVEIRRREEELMGTMGSDRTAEEQSAREHEWMIEFLGDEIEKVQKRIRDLVAVSGEEQPPAQVSHSETGV